MAILYADLYLVDMLLVMSKHGLFVMSTRYDANRKRVEIELISQSICIRCRQGSTEHGKTVCHICSQRAADITKKRRAAFNADGICISCGLHVQEPNRKLCLICLIKARNVAKASSRALKLAALNAYGGPICACPPCGTKCWSMLQIDHIKNNGAAHRREIGRGSRHEPGTGGSTTMYRWLRDNDYPPGFQVLCSNCNLSKYLSGGQCEHII